MSPSIWAWPDSLIDRVIDGDSVVAIVRRDLGFNGTATFKQRLRLNRINAPKVQTAAGKAAAARVDELVGTHAAPFAVYIETVGPYKYGDEWMAEIVLPDGRNLSDVLVVEHLAVYWDGTGPRPADG